MSAPLKHSFAFDPTYGYDEASLRKVGTPPEPADFASFWRETYQELRRTPLNLACRAIACDWPERELFEVEFDSLDGVRVGGWFNRPKGVRASRGFVIGHGYGGRGAADREPPAADAVAIYPCARGFHRSAHAVIPGTSDRHVVHGIESRQTYVHRGCAADVWAATSALLELEPQVERNVGYCGGSFGGGIGAMAVAWEERFVRAYLDVPSFGNHPIRLTCPCVGSGESVRKYHRQHPEVVEVLKYFDSALAAKHIRIPTLVAAAAFDPAVPPPGQFAVYNAIPVEKRLVVRQAAHFEFPGQAEDDRRVWQAVREWFGSDAKP